MTRGLFVIFFALASKMSALAKQEERSRINLAAENKALQSENSRLYWQLHTHKVTLMAIGSVLIITACFAWFLVRMRRQSHLQREAIEIQAEALLRLNDELKSLNKHLEARIQERTAQLEVQNQRIAEYTFINAHKLRAPVASILGLINLFQKASVDEKDQIAFHLQKCGQQLDQMIRELTLSLEEAVVADQDESPPAVPSDSLDPGAPLIT